MRSKLTRGIALATCSILLASFVACNTDDTKANLESGDKNAPVVDVSAFSSAEIWSTYATEKILQDVDKSEYAELMMDAELVIDSCKGEYEGAQLIISASKDISEWTASVGSLTHKNGSASISADKLTVSAEKYTNVPVNMQQNGMPTGNYPDCLVPMQNYVNSGENKIKAGENQGIYLSVNVPYTQEPGVYEGTLTLTLDKERKNVPITLTVYDLEVNQETHMRSKFNSCFSQAIGELDSTQEMFSKYIDVMLDYRIMPSFLIHQYNIHDTEESILQYAEEAARRVLSGKLTNFNIPSFLNYDSNGYPLPNVVSLHKYILALAETSIKYSEETGEQIDLISRAIYTSGSIDEPTIQHTERYLPGFCSTYKKGLEDAQAKVEKLKESYPEQGELIDRLVESVADIRLVITTQYDEALATSIDTWCPLFNYYDTEEMRENYAEQEERWWYGCNVPTSPYPTYEIDEQLVNPRVSAWMMSEYDITGVLYWAVDEYFGNEGYMENYYDTANRYGNYSGEGFLFYPGAKYGVFGPLATLRLEAIRDGIEEFELMYNLKRKYEEKGISYEAALASVCSTLYSGTKVTADSKTFYETRKSLIELCMLADCEAEVLLKNVDEDENGKTTYEILVHGDYALKSNGVEIQNKVPYGSGTLYTIDRERKDTVNVLSFDVTTESGTYGYSISLGGKISSYDATDLITGIESGGAKIQATLVTEAGISEQEVVKIELDAVENGIQTFKYKNDIFTGLDKTVGKVVFEIYNPSSEEITFSISAKYTGAQYARQFASATLASGINYVEINGVNAMQWDTLGKIESLIVYTDASTKGSYGAKTIYLVNVKVYGA